MRSAIAAMRSRHLQRLACALCLFVCAGPRALATPPAAISEQSFASIRSAMRALIRQEMKAKDVVGLSIALVDDQKVVWTEGFGYADRARRVPAGADTLYATGGLSQLFTATAVLQLAERDAINLDQPVTNFLPEFSILSRAANAPAITPRHLLTHHSGLPAMHFKNMWTPRPEPLATFVARLKEEYAAAPAGQVYSPSFPGYDLLGRLIEIHCQQVFARCMQERLLVPLGMPHSTFTSEPTEPTLFAMHYWKDKPIAAPTVRDLPAAGLVSSVAELTHFVRMLFADGKLDGKQILKARSVHAMLRAQNTAVALDLDTRVGMPWQLSGVRFAQAGAARGRTPEAANVAWLNNYGPFGRGRIVIVPEHKLGVIVLTNSSDATEAVEKISERLMELVLQTRTPMPSAEPHAVAVTQPSAPLTREDIVGQYATLLGLITVQADKGHYRAVMMGKTFDLRRQPDGLFSAEYRFLSLFPIPLSLLKETHLTTTKISGHRLAVAYYRNQAYRLGERIEPLRLSAAWRKRLGEYQAVERDPLLDLVKFGNVALDYTDGLLYIRYRVPGWLGLIANIPVKPVSDTELVIEGTGWLMGETVQVVRRAGKETLLYSGYEFRRIGAH
jgi:CubicO group peptidase (beta-lactamase class C family)